MDSHRNKPSSSDHHLIAEQPGLAVLFTGLVISIFCGYSLKGYFSPQRVSANIEKAASHIHKDVKVQFRSANVSFSDGIVPRLSVVISGVRMESEQKCWGAPVLEVDELTLPLSFWSLISGGPPVKHLEANKVQLRIREVVSNCTPPAEASSLKPVGPVIRLSPSAKDMKYQNDLRSLSINEFKIVAEKYPQFSSELMQFSVNVKSFDPKVIEVRAKTHLLKDQSVGDYLSHANLFVQYQESPQVKVQSHFFGNWREGHYSLIASYTFDEQMLSVEADLKHIPLSQILGILKKYNLASQKLNGRQAWISSKARLVAPIDKIRTSPVEVRDLILEGDVGDLRVENIKIQSLEPFTYSPIVVDIGKLDVERLLFLLNQQKSSTMLGHLGFFSGRAEIHSEQKMKLTGEHRGLEFVFSNKGQRELQVIDRAVGDISLLGNQWTFSVNRLEPKGGLFLGDLNFSADRDFKKVKIKTRVDELALSPAVQKLMTGGGEIGALNLDLSADLTDGKISALKGLLRLDGVDIEGMSFGKTRATLDWHDHKVVINAQVKSMAVSPTSPGYEVLKQVTIDSWRELEKPLRMDLLSGVLTTQELNSFSWKNVQAHIGKVGRFVTDGSWDEQGLLKGTVHSRDGKLHRKWLIQGDRKNPIFVEDMLNSKGSRR